MEERLQKVLAKAGVASRRHSEELITKGKVKVNGKIVTELGIKVDPYKDKIEVSGKPVPHPEKKVYYLLNKPRGYVTTLSDERGRKTVMDLLEGVEQRVYPVGRLDYDSEGLLLLTNDGTLTQALTHPKHKVKKTYLARVEGVPESEKLLSMAKGLELEDGITAPAEVKLAGIGDKGALLEITIHEGRNRQVRRMCEHIGHKVIRLQRTRVGPLVIEDLKSGQFRPLTKKELREVMALAGIKLNVNELQEATTVKVKSTGIKGVKARPLNSEPKKGNSRQGFTKRDAEKAEKSPYKSKSSENRSGKSTFKSRDTETRSKSKGTGKVPYKSVTAGKSNFKSRTK